MASQLCALSLLMLVGEKSNTCDGCFLEYLAPQAQGHPWVATLRAYHWSHGVNVALLPIECHLCVRGHKYLPLAQCVLFAWMSTMVHWWLNLLSFRLINVFSFLVLSISCHINGRHVSLERLGEKEYNQSWQWQEEEETEAWNWII